MITRIEGMMKLGEANACLKQMKVSLDVAEHAKRNAETEAALAKESSEISKLEVKWIELMLSLVTEERDQLRNIVNKLKKQKNVEAGDETENGTLLQESMYEKVFSPTQFPPMCICDFLLHRHLGTHYPPPDTFLLSLWEFTCFELGFQIFFHQNNLSFFKLRP